MEAFVDMDVRAPPRPVYRFGAYRLDASRLALEWNGEAVPTTPRVLSTLLHLVENAGRTVSKEDLLGALWPGRYADEANLSQAISAVRKTLAANGAGEALILTVPGKGYRFTGDAVIEGAAPSPPPPPPGPSGPVVADGRWRSPWLRPAGAATALVVALLIAWRVVDARRPRAADARTDVVVAALQNDTGEPMLERLIPRLLQIDLAQSPQVQVDDDAKTSQILALMERPRDTGLTPAVAREVCVRGNGGVLVAPAAARLGDRYVLILLASDCVSGQTLWQARRVVGKADIPSALDQMAAGFRRRLGESQTSISRFDVPLLSARTASLDALQAYSQAAWLSARGDDVEAISLYRQAIDLDGRFGLAWLGLAQTFYHARQWREDAEAMTHAYALRDSMSEREGLFTAYRYHLVVEKDFVAALDSIKALALLYPHDAGILNCVSFLQFDLGQYADAIATAEQAMRDDARSPTAVFNLMRALTRSGHAARAKGLGEQAAEARLVDSRVYEQRILADIELGDPAGAKRLLDAATGTPFARDALLQYSSIFGDGRPREFDAGVEQADVLGRRQGLRMDWPAVAAALADLGADERARRRLALVEPDLRVAKYHRAQALVGDPAQEEADLARDEARWPRDTLRNAEYGPEARAILALRRGDPQGAVSAVSAPDPYEWRTLEFPYVRAQALLAAGDGLAAAASFRAIIAHPGWSNWPQYGLSYLGLARALRLDHDVDGARQAYDAFLKVWRLADPDMPQLREARDERSALAARSDQMH